MGVSAELLLGVTVALLVEPVVDVVELSPELSAVVRAGVLVTTGVSFVELVVVVVVVLGVVVLDADDIWE